MLIGIRINVLGKLLFYYLPGLFCWLEQVVAGEVLPGTELWEYTVAGESYEGVTAANGDQKIGAEPFP